MFSIFTQRKAYQCVYKELVKSSNNTILTVKWMLSSSSQDCYDTLLKDLTNVRRNYPDVKDIEYPKGFRFPKIGHPSVLKANLTFWKSKGFLKCLLKYKKISLWARLSLNGTNLFSFLWQSYLTEVFCVYFTHFFPKWSSFISLSLTEGGIQTTRATTNGHSWRTIIGFDSQSRTHSPVCGDTFIRTHRHWINVW